MTRVGSRGAEVECKALFEIERSKFEGLGLGFKGRVHQGC